MEFQHWQDDTGDTFFSASNIEEHRAMFVGTPRHCCTITACCWTEAMRRYHIHQGWEPYRPMTQPDGRPYDDDRCEVCGYGT